MFYGVDEFVGTVFVSIEAAHCFVLGWSLAMCTMLFAWVLWSVIFEGFEYLFDKLRLKTGVPRKGSKLPPKAE